MGSSSSKLCCCKSSKKKESPSKEHQEFPQELAALHGDGDLLGNISEQLQKSEAALHRRHEKELQETTEEHKRELTQLKDHLCSIHSAEKKQLQQIHAEDVERLKKELQKKEAAQSESRIEELKASHSEYVKILREECETAIAGLIKLHKQEQKSLTESFTKTITCLQEIIEELTAHVNTFQKKTKKIEDAILRRDLSKDSQDSHPPNLFWEQELESLHFVVEMKNERIHQLDKEVLQMKNLIEINNILEEKVKILQQENEDLKVRLSNQQEFARQLSKEHVDLQQTLEKEAMAKERLCQEKDELVWKLQNGNVSPTVETSWKPLHSESLDLSLR
ncbi:coiled-coil domain-containing protein 69-like isoform X1 [Hemiscyllium ocellatum]|uniref:coiled-coil domain-containing protein 69-like isoform X1 n=1 Tax=Hemiscyllium ocellatum TaxID=170820 RepID=UPI002966940A|nr:coiled-coil domain-containing protein 69-like isoform X1 [Hemiscyllium ocellatum]